MRRIFVVAVVVASLSIAQAQATALVNGDFSSFDGWTGVTYDGVNESVLTDEAQLGGTPDTNENFTRDGVGSATIFARGATTYEARLEQTFDLPTVGLGGQLLIGFDYLAVSTDFRDLLQVVLLPDGYDEFSPDPLLSTPLIEFGLTGIGSVFEDVTAFSGMTVVFEALSSSFDFEDDSLTISNLFITEVTVQVSVVPPFALVLLGLIAMQRRLREVVKTS